MDHNVPGTKFAWTQVNLKEKVTQSAEKEELLWCQSQEK